MNELTIEIDDFSYFKSSELEIYLLNLSGVIDVEISTPEPYFIHIKYDSTKIGINVLRMEIILFLDKEKVPFLRSFDKHAKNKVKKFDIVVADLCCEYCFMGMIDDLFLLEGILKASSNFFQDELYLNTRNVVITVYYNPELIKKEEIKKIEFAFHS